MIKDAGRWALGASLNGGRQTAKGVVYSLPSGARRRLHGVTTLPAPRGSKARESAKTSKTGASDARRIDWRRIAYNALVSRALDDVEEATNRNRASVPREHLVLYQFSARGHDVAQSILGAFIDHPHDAASAYYRSRPLLIALGLSIEDALGSPLGRAGGFSDGRDIGVVCNLPQASCPIVLATDCSIGTLRTT